MSAQAQATKSAETTREAVIFFFSDDGKYVRDLLEDTVVDGFDSLSKDALKQLLMQMGWYEQLFPFPNIGRKKPSELELINMTSQDQKRVTTILKMWDYFGPSPKNMGAGSNDQSSYLNVDNFVSLGSEVGPYLSVVYPQMLEYFSNIFNRLYGRGKDRVARDFGINPNMIPDIKIPPNLAMPGQPLGLPRRALAG